MRSILLKDGDEVIAVWTEEDVRSILMDYYSTIPYFTYDSLKEWLERSESA